MVRPRLTLAYASLQASRRAQSQTSHSPSLRLRLISARLRGISTALRELSGTHYSPASPAG